MPVKVTTFDPITLDFDYQIAHRGQNYDVITSFLAERLLEQITPDSYLRHIDLMDVSAIRSNFVEAVKSYILFKYYEWVKDTEMEGGGKYFKTKKVPEKYTKALSYYMNCDKDRKDWYMMCWEIKMKNEGMPEVLKGI